MPVQPSLPEELPQMAVKAWERRFLMELQTCQPVLIFFARVTVQPEVKFLLLIYNDRQSTGHVQIKKMALIVCSSYYICLRPMSVPPTNVCASDYTCGGTTLMAYN